MVVKLYFSDGTYEIKSFTEEDFNKYKLLDKLKEYFIKYLAPIHDIESWRIFDINYIVDTNDLSIKKSWRRFDWRAYFNYSESFIGLEVEGREVIGVTFFDENSYEYNLSYLECGDPYNRWVFFNYKFDNYPLNKLNFDYENW